MIKWKLLLQPSNTIQGADIMYFWGCYTPKLPWNVPWLPLLIIMLFKAKIELKNISHTKEYRS